MPEYITADGFKHLEEELEELRTVRRREVAEYLKRATEVGGAVDNAEYDESKNEQSFIEGRVRYLEGLLSNAIVVPDRRGVAEAVEIGSSVTVASPKGRKRHYMLVGSAETAPLEGKISNESPVGRALLGRKVGEEAEVTTPSGPVKLSVAKIE